MATILSAQCTDKRVNAVTPELFRKYPAIQDFANVSQAELAQDIRSTGFFNNKAKSLIGAANKILTDFGGEVPRSIEELLTVPGAARKTANVVLGTAFGIASGIVVDTHVQRISRRLDLTKAEDPVKIEKDSMKVIPKEKWILFSHQIARTDGRSALREARTVPSARSIPSVMQRIRARTSVLSRARKEVGSGQRVANPRSPATRFPLPAVRYRFAPSPVKCRPLWIAYSASSKRSDTPSLSKILCRWFFTVCSLMNIFSAISLFL